MFKSGPAFSGLAQFLAAQITEVHDYTKLYKTESMAYLFHTGQASERFFFILELIKLGRTNADRKVSRELYLSLANGTLQTLFELAQLLDVDIGDQLKEELTAICANYLDSSCHQDRGDGLKLRLKLKLCGLTNQTPSLVSSSTNFKRSEVDPSRIITDDCWAVSFVRLPDRTGTSEHVFIVLEGKTGRKAKIWFADFIAAKKSDVFKPGTADGKVRLDYHESEDPTSRLFFQCEKEMMDVRAIERRCSITTLIPKATAEILIENIKKEKKNPPKFHIAGNKSLVADASAKSTRNSTGHNCFTFAKKMLNDLNDVNIKLPEEGLDTWIYSASSNYLVDKSFKSSKFGFPLIIVIATGTVVSFLLHKAFYQ